VRRAATPLIHETRLLAQEQPTAFELSSTSAPLTTLIFLCHQLW
jgi:hypothetical protein